MKYYYRQDSSGTIRGPRSKYGSAGFQSPSKALQHRTAKREGMRVIEVEFDNQPYVGMTDEEAFSYHEQQAVRHMELAKQYADKLGKEYK